MFEGASYLIFQKAERLRDNMTPAETLLWGYLKGNQLGARFRRQHPIGIYIADFYCHQHKLILELDGSIHLEPEVLQNDIERQAVLEPLGYKVLRFTIIKSLKV